MKLIERTSLLTQLRETKGTPDIKIITGVRRAGGSTEPINTIPFVRCVDLLTSLPCRDAWEFFYALWLSKTLAVPLWLLRQIEVDTNERLFRIIPT